MYGLLIFKLLREKQLAIWRTICKDLALKHKEEGESRGGSQLRERERERCLKKKKIVYYFNEQ